MCWWLIKKKKKRKSSIFLCTHCNFFYKSNLFKSIHRRPTVVLHYSRVIEYKPLLKGALQAEKQKFIWKQEASPIQKCIFHLLQLNILFADQLRGFNKNGGFFKLDPHGTNKGCSWSTATSVFFFGLQLKTWKENAKMCQVINAAAEEMVSRFLLCIKTFVNVNRKLKPPSWKHYDGCPVTDSILASQAHFHSVVVIMMFHQFNLFWKIKHKN